MTGEDMVLRKMKRRRFNIVIARFLGVLGFFLLIGWLMWPFYRIGLNTTPSLPGVFYLISIESEDYLPVSGDIVIFVPPKNRFYGDKTQFMKMVVGTAGDRVSYIEQLFYINDDYMGEAKIMSSDGEKMRRGPEGLIPPFHYFVYTPHEMSFDSRYEDIGFIPRDRIFGRATRLL